MKNIFITKNSIIYLLKIMCASLGCGLLHVAGKTAPFGWGLIVVGLFYNVVKGRKERGVIDYVVVLVGFLLFYMFFSSGYEEEILFSLSEKSIVIIWVVSVTWIVLEKWMQDRVAE